jgi:hypothetical protein
VAEVREHNVGASARDLVVEGDRTALFRACRVLKPNRRP